MNKKRMMSFVVVICLLCTALIPSVSFAGETYSYATLKKNEYRTYRLQTKNTISSKYIIFTPCKGTVSQDLLKTKWESRKMMYLVQVYTSKGKLYKQFTWNTNNINKTSQFKVSLSKNTKYKISITALGCYGTNIAEKYHKTKKAPQLKVTFNNCGLY